MRKTIAASTLLVLVACTTPKAPTAGGDGGPSSGADSGTLADGGLTAAAACAMSASAKCMNLAKCEPATFQTRYGSEAQCEAQLGPSCENSQAAAGTGQTPELQAACASALATESCADELLGVTPAPCMAPVGTLDGGSPCAFNGQCQTQFCMVPAGTLCGTCAAYPADGAPCSQTGCAPTQICNAAGNCQTPATDGGTCGMTAPCGAGLGCVKVGTAHTCQALLSAAGATCSTTNITVPDCDRRLGLVCDPTSHNCVQISFATAASPCGEIDGGIVACTASVCTGATAMNPVGTCDAPGATGAACSTTAGSGCEVPGVCLLDAGSAIGTCEVANAANCQ